MQGRFAPLSIRSNEDLTIAVGPENLAQRFQLTFQLNIIIDLAVEDQPVTIVFIGQRLMPCVTQIDNRQSAVAERKRAAPGFEDLPALTVPPSMTYDVYIGFIGRKAKGRKNAAHDSMPLRQPMPST